VIICFEQGELLFINTFDYETVNDIAYFLIYTCKQLNINQIEDNLHFCGNKDTSMSVLAIVKNYIEHTDFIPLHSSKYKVNPESVCYYDIIALAECG